jgi:hypothetical protein
MEAIKFMLDTPEKMSEKRRAPCDGLPQYAGRHAIRTESEKTMAHQPN